MDRHLIRNTCKVQSYNFHGSVVGQTAYRNFTATGFDFDCQGRSYLGLDQVTDPFTSGSNNHRGDYIACHLGFHRSNCRCRHGHLSGDCGKYYRPDRQKFVPDFSWAA